MMLFEYNSQHDVGLVCAIMEVHGAHFSQWRSIAKYSMECLGLYQPSGLAPSSPRRRLNSNKAFS